MAAIVNTCATCQWWRAVSPDDQAKLAGVADSLRECIRFAVWHWSNDAGCFVTGNLWTSADFGCNHYVRWSDGK